MSEFATHFSDVQAVCPSPRSEDATPTADVQADSENEVTAGKGTKTCFHVVQHYWIII